MAKKSIAKQLSLLTYRDMVDLSEIIAEKLDIPAVTPPMIAHIFTSLPTHNEQTDSTNDMLADMFRRKRAISIMPLKEGVFKISCASYEGAVVFDKDIREGVSQLLDTLTVLNGLQ